MLHYNAITMGGNPAEEIIIIHELVIRHGKTALDGLIRIKELNYV